MSSTIRLQDSSTQEYYEPEPWSPIDGEGVIKAPGELDRAGQVEVVKKYAITKARSRGKRETQVSQVEVMAALRNTISPPTAGKILREACDRAEFLEMNGDGTAYFREDLRHETAENREKYR